MDFTKTRATSFDWSIIVTVRRIPFFIMLIVLSLALLPGCQRSGTPTAAPSPVEVGPTEPAAPEATPTITAIPEPQAALVNGDSISLAAYEAELARLQAYQQEAGITMSAAEQSQQVLDGLVDEMLLAQAARQAGFEAIPEEVDARVASLVAQLGSPDQLAAWQSENGYTDENFRQALARAIEAAWQRDQIANAVPETADQVHARQILVLEEQLANDIYSNLQSGASFATLVDQYDPLTGGDLGWFPAGYLTRLEVEQAAFSLQPGQYSNVIATDFGYHIIQVIERDPQHPLSVEARRALQHQAVADWIQQRRSESDIQILVSQDE